jgi:hypothetical protein
VCCVTCGEVTVCVMAVFNNVNNDDGINYVQKVPDFVLGGDATQDINFARRGPQHLKGDGATKCPATRRADNWALGVRQFVG